MPSTDVAEKQAEDAKAEGMLTKMEMQNVLEVIQHDPDLVIPLEAKTWTIQQFELFVMSNGKLRPKWCSIPDETDLVNNNMSTEDVETALSDAADWILNADAILIGSGAGMGVDSGLSTFRGRNAGVWPGLEVVGLAYEEICDPKWFKSDPELVWAFWNFCHNAYQATQPHRGYQIVRKWTERAPLGAFSFTSNIDSHWENCGFPADRIIEVHGAVRWLQCSKGCNNKVWAAPADLNLKEDPQTSRVRGTLPKCPDCQAIARPCVQMFGGDTLFCKSRRAGQIREYDGWLNALQARPDAKTLRLACVELGCGLTVPTVRKELESVCKRFPGARLIRVNPEQPGLAKELKKVGCSLPLPASVALKALEPSIVLNPDEELVKYQLWGEHGGGIEVTAPVRRDHARILRLAEGYRRNCVVFSKDYNNKINQFLACSLLDYRYRQEFKPLDIVPDNLCSDVRRHGHRDDNGDLAPAVPALEATVATDEERAKTLAACSRPSNGLDPQKGSPICNEPLVFVCETSNWDPANRQLQFKPMWSTPSGKCVRHQLCIKLGEPEPPNPKADNGSSRKNSLFASCAFQVLSSNKKWNWRVYPCKSPISTAAVSRLSGWSAVNVLVPGESEAVKAAQGGVEGHNKNFNILEPLGTVITICVDILLEAAEHSKGEAANELHRPRVWYEVCQTANPITCVDREKPSQAQLRLALRLRGHELPEEPTIGILCKQVKFNNGGLCAPLQAKKDFVLKLLQGLIDAMADPAWQQSAEAMIDSRRLKEMLGEMHGQLLPKFGLEPKTGGVMMMTTMINQFSFFGDKEVWPKTRESMELSHLPRLGEQIVVKVSFISNLGKSWEAPAANGKQTRIAAIRFVVGGMLQFSDMERVCKLKFFKKQNNDYVWIHDEQCVADEMFMFEPEGIMGVQWPENFRLSKVGPSGVTQPIWDSVKNSLQKMDKKDRQNYFLPESGEEVMRITDKMLKSKALIELPEDQIERMNLFSKFARALALKAAEDPGLKLALKGFEADPRCMFMLKELGETNGSFQPPSREKGNLREFPPTKPPHITGYPQGAQLIWLREGWSFFTAEMTRMSDEDWAHWSVLGSHKEMWEVFWKIMMSPFMSKVGKDPALQKKIFVNGGKTDRRYAREDPVLKLFRNEGPQDRKSSPRLLDHYFSR